MAMFEEIVLLFALIAGIILGEFLSARVFGRPKKTVLVIFELFVFVIILVLLSESIFLYEDNLYAGCGINFLIGSIATVVAVAAATAVGFMGAMADTGLTGRYSENEKMIIKLADSLAGRGLSKEDIAEALSGAGFKRKAVADVLSSHPIKQRPNPLAREIARLEAELAEFKQKKVRK
ncbi:MAG: hypothetical protein V1911_02185 [Candidatus Micrarchaeota archaeon]